MFDKNGFTLIELLVVVLIIGVLAAIAVPQYNKAVARSRWGDAQIRLKAVATAEQSYWLQTGGYTTNLGDLDISVDTTPPKNFSAIAIHLYAEGAATQSHAEYPYGVSSAWAWITLHDARLYCGTATGNAAGNSFCKAETGKTACDTTLEPGYCFYPFS